MIRSEAFRDVSRWSAFRINNQGVSFNGLASMTYALNLVFHEMAIVPMVSPPGTFDVACKSCKRTSVRLIPFYNGSTDVSTMRLDVLYGIKALDPRLATRITGTA